MPVKQRLESMRDFSLILYLLEGAKVRIQSKKYSFQHGLYRIDELTTKKQTKQSTFAA